MASMGTSLDKVKIIKSKSVITIMEMYTTLDYNGLGYVQDKNASIALNTNIVVHNKTNLQIAIKGNDIVIRSTAGAMHTFDFEVVEVEGMTKGNDIIQFIQNLMS